jgi:hypothetical protein
MESDQLVLGQQYHVMTMNRVKIKGNLLQVNDSIITIQIKSGHPVAIPISKLYSIQKPKFSIGKSIALGGLVLGTGILVIEVYKADQSSSGYFGY